MANSLREALERAKDVKPIGNADGIPVVTFEDYAAKVQEDAVSGVDISPIRTNLNGTVAASSVRYMADAPARLYANRVKVGKGRVYVVDDYRAIQEQLSGRIYAKNLKAYVIARDEAGKLVLEKTITISDDDFTANYTAQLDYAVMAEVKELVANHKSEPVETVTI